MNALAAADRVEVLLLIDNASAPARTPAWSSC